MDDFREINLSDIEWDDFLRDITDKDIEDMTKSVIATGLIHPIIVERKEGGKYRGIAGRLRFEASKRAGKATILARIHCFMDNSHRKVWQLVENLVRREPNALTIGEGYEKLREYYRKEGIERDGPIIESIQKEIQEVCGENAPSKRTVYQYLQIAKDFPEEVKRILRSVTSNTFGRAHALQLLRLRKSEHHRAMLDFAEKIRNQELTTRNQLKAAIDDYFKMHERGIAEVNKAVESQDISLRHAAIISEANGDVQKPLLEIARRGSLKPIQVKKLVDFTLAHNDRIREILAKGVENPEKAVAIAEGKSILETAEDVKAFFRGRRGLAEEEEFDIPCTCPLCKTLLSRKIRVNWAKGELTFE